MSGMRIDEFFAANPAVAVALSGGLGSAYLLFAAAAVRADVRAYCVACPGADERELRTALGLAKLLGVPFRLLEPEPGTAAGARGILRLIRERAASDGCPQVLAGVDADAPEGSHWLRACSELGVLTPLRLCGIGRDEIKHRSGNSGLSGFLDVCAADEKTDIGRNML